MNCLPEQIIWDILRRIKNTSDRNSVSLVCKRFHYLEKEQREYLRVGCGLNPPNESLAVLCNRFPNLYKVEIFYSGWTSKLGKQLDDQGMYILFTHCPALVELSLSFCAFITDSTLQFLSFCIKLRSLKLNFTPGITGFGIMSVVMGCKNLSTLHLVRCLNVSNVEWIEYLGKLETLEDLSIKNCRAIGEGDLIKLGLGWRKLKCLEFEVDANYRYMKFYNPLIEEWKQQWISCESMKELSLVNCLMNPGRVLSCVLRECQKLEKIHLDMCLGVRDKDLIALSQKSINLKSLSLRVPSDFLPPSSINNSLQLSDESLIAIAENCPQLESVKISFSDGDFPSLSFTLSGILSMIQKCPIKDLVLDHVYSFNDLGMEALCSAHYLETLELIKCQEISDAGIQLVRHFPQLIVLKLSKCLGITDTGLRHLVGSQKLNLLMVEDCPQISNKGVHGAARCVSYKQDLSWIY